MIRNALTPSNPHELLPELPDALARFAHGVEFPDPLEAPALRWGIIGAGGIARTFARDVPRYTRAEIVAVASRDLGRASAFAREMGIPMAFGSYEELVEDPNVDAVYVATINTLHAEHALLALNAGKPVLVEKPFTMDSVQAETVLNQASRSRVFAMEAMWTRHLPQSRVIRQVIANGDLGCIVSVQADHGQSLLDVPRLARPELGGGALMDLGIYPVSFLHEALGRPASVHAVARLNSDGIDLGDAITVQTDRALGVARCTMDGRSATSAEIVFECGALELPLQFYRPGVLRLRTFEEGAPDDGATVEWDATLPGGFQYEAAEVARRLAVGATESPDMTWQDTWEVMRVMDRIRADAGIVFPWE